MGHRRRRRRVTPRLRKCPAEGTQLAKLEELRRQQQLDRAKARSAMAELLLTQGLSDNKVRMLLRAAAAYNRLEGKIYVVDYGCWTTEIDDEPDLF